MDINKIIELIKATETSRCKCKNPYCPARLEYDKAKGDIIAALQAAPKLQIIKKK